MNLLNDTATWMFIGLISFVILGAIAFFKRNAIAKNEKNMDTNSQSKPSGEVSVQKNKE